MKYKDLPTTNNAAISIDKKLEQNKMVLVTVGTGGGKTFMAIHAVGRLTKKAHLLVFTTKKQVDKQHWNESIDAYNKATRSRLTYEIYNYDKLSSKKHFNEIKKNLNTKNVLKVPVIMILDEAHRIKNSKGIWSKRIKQLSYLPAINRIIGLTATPISNSYLDSIAYLILNGYYTSFTDFKRKHVKFVDDYNQPIVKNWNGEIDRNLFNDPDEIDRQLNHMVITFDIKKIIPKRHGMTYEFHLSEKHQEEYDQIKKNYKAGLYDSIQTTIKAMREYVSTHSDQRNKMLSNILNNKFVTKPVLIFYKYNIELNDLRKYLDKNHPDFKRIEINGQTKISKEMLAKPKDPKTIFLIQYQSGSEGLNAPWSNVSIFYAPTDSYQQFKQAVGRNIRAGQKGDVYQFRFIYKDTVNEHMWDLIENKQNFSVKLMNQFLEESNKFNLKGGGNKTN